MFPLHTCCHNLIFERKSCTSSKNPSSPYGMSSRISLVAFVVVGPRSRSSQPVRGVGYEPGVSVTPEPMRDAMTTRGNESAMLRPASTAILATSRPLWHTGTILKPSDDDGCSLSCRHPKGSSQSLSEVRIEVEQDTCGVELDLWD